MKHILNLLQNSMPLKHDDQDPRVTHILYHSLVLPTDNSEELHNCELTVDDFFFVSVCLTYRTVKNRDTFRKTVSVGHLQSIDCFRNTSHEWDIRNDYI